MSIPDGFPERLRQAREAKGYAVNVLGRMAGLAPGMVSKYEFGDRPNVSVVTVAKLADALGVTIDWLWSGKAPETTGQVIDDFFLAVERRGLRKVIAHTPGRWTLDTIAKAVLLDLKSDPDGVPEDGWVPVLEAVEAGKYAVSYGDAAAVERATKAQVKKRRKKRAH